jgi:hypothetical protein
MRAREFIQESKTALRKSVRQALPNLTTSTDLNNNNHPYLAYRFGVALAPSPNTESVHDSGPIGSDFAMVDFSEGDAEIRRAAAKKMGIKFDKGTGKGSKELSDTIINKTSPVAKPKKNKYGV